MFSLLFYVLQLLDLPGIIEGAKDGKGRGKQVITGMYSFVKYIYSTDASRSSLVCMQEDVCMQEGLAVFSQSLSEEYCGIGPCLAYRPYSGSI